MHKLLTLAALVLATVSASAQYTEDRDNRAPVNGNWFYSNVTTTTLAALVSQGHRFTDIEVTQTSPSLRFQVAYLKNTGSYGKTWWYYYGLTSAQVSSRLTANQARLTDLEVYNTSSGLRFTVLMEQNSVRGKAWWWYINSSVSGLMAQASAKGARLVDVEQYTIGTKTYYAGILLKNSGKDAKSWWAYFNVTSTYLNSVLRTNGARVWDFDRLSNGRYNVLMTRFSGEQAWHWFGRTGSQVSQLANQYGARIIDLQRYNTSAGIRYDVAFLNAANTLSARMRDLMLSKTNGAVGAHLRYIPLTSSGYDLAGINTNTRYEPASTLKTLHHVTTMRDVYLRRRNLGSNYSVRYYTTSTNSCPQSRSAYSRTLEAILTGMMQNSDNAYTRVITDLYGMTGLTNNAKALGMPNTKIGRHMGCAPLANYSTLTDLGTLHERVIKGLLGSQRAKFYALMNNGVWSALRTVVQQEAAKLSMTTAQVNSFLANMQITGKGGNDTVGTVNNWSWYGYAKLPIWRNGGTSTREYSFGAWVNNSTSKTTASNAVNAAVNEILRDAIRSALLTLRNRVLGKFTSFGTACGGKFTPLQHTAVGVPDIGQRVTFQLTGSRTSNLTTSFKIGLSRTTWNRIPLPLHLAFLGANGCYWRTDALIELLLTANQGKANITTLIPNDRSLIGTQIYTQFLTVERGANAAGLTATNGLTTLIGGQK